MPRSLLTTLALLGLSLTADLSFQHRSLAQTACGTTVIAPSRPPAPTAQYPTDRQIVAYGDRICWNQTVVELPWIQWQGIGTAALPAVGVADWGLERLTGAGLQDSNDWASQPLDWFPTLNNGLMPPGPGAEAPTVHRSTTHLSATHRYLDLVPILRTLGATAQAEGSVLRVITPPAQVLELRPYPASPAAPSPNAPAPLQQLEIFLDRPLAWSWEPGPTPTLRLAANLVPDLRVPQATNPQANEWRNWGNLPLRVRTAGQQVWLQFPNLRQQPRVMALQNPPRLVVALDQPINPNPDRTIAWGPGLTWQQTNVTVGRKRFPVQILNLDRPFTTPNQRPTSPFSLRPIWVGHDLPAPTIVGIAPLVQLARQGGVMAALNGSYFNRNTQMPLGALRYQGEWISGPILGRGVMAWNDAGEVVFDRAVLTETVTLGPKPQAASPTPAGPPAVSFPVLFLNSGYVKAGLSRYTAAWGDRYSPLTDNETVITIVGDRVQQMQRLGPAGATSVAIPPNGYLLTARSYQTAANQFSPGQTISLSQSLTPPQLSAYPYMLGAGPLLLQGGRSVLDGSREQFSAPFLNQGAYRTAVGTTPQGQLLWVTVQPAPGGAGPTLAELAILLQNLGISDALNLDGGSSTSLYLGGQLVNRDPRSAARVHNGLGLFLTPVPSLGRN